MEEYVFRRRSPEGKEIPSGPNNHRTYNKHIVAFRIYTMNISLKSPITDLVFYEKFEIGEK